MLHFDLVQMKKIYKNIFVFLIFLILIASSDKIFAIPCLEGEHRSKNYTEAKLLRKAPTYKNNENTFFQSDLYDSSGNKIETVQYELTNHLLEFQCINYSKSNLAYVGTGFTITGAVPLLLYRPNAEANFTDENVSTKSTLINYYGAGVIGEISTPSAFPRESIGLALAANIKGGYEYYTGEFNYKYADSVLQSNKLKEYLGWYVESSVLFKWRIANSSNKSYSILIGNSMRIASQHDIKVENKLLEWGLSYAW